MVTEEMAMISRMIAPILLDLLVSYAETLELFSAAFNCRVELKEKGFS